MITVDLKTSEYYLIQAALNAYFHEAVTKLEYPVELGFFEKRSYELQKEKTLELMKKFQ